MITPNVFARTALLLWVLVTLYFFWRYRPTLAVAMTFIGAAMALPELWGYNVPLLPDLGKNTLPSLTAFTFALFAFPRKLIDARPLRGIDLCFVLMILGHAGTVVTNPEPTGFGPNPNSGLVFRDFVAMVLGDVFEVYIPFLLGRTLFRSGRDLRDLFFVLAFGAMIYALPGLYETRQSPVLHKNIYGYYCNFFFQSKRGGSWRPNVFMTHGLVFARFMLLGIVALAVLHRAKLKLGFMPAMPILLGLFVFNLICRSTGAIILSIVAVPVVLFSTPKTQARFGYVLGLLVILYPLLSANGLFPSEKLVELAEQLSPERADSLDARFEQEEELAGKLEAKPWFGWGEFLRSHEFDERTGEDITIVDGEWLIIYSKRGLIGFLAWFGLYVLPILYAPRAVKLAQSQNDRHMLAGMTVIMALLAVEMIPNSRGSLPQFFIAGALLGAVQGTLRAPKKSRARGRRRSKDSDALPLDPGAATRPA